MSATKGPSNLYGNPAGIPTEHINYPYAVTFNQRTLMKHYNDHGDEVGATSAQEYQELAIDFANDVNNVTHDSFVDQNGSTYKFSYETGEFAIIKSDGTVITYYMPDRGEAYWEDVKRKHSV